ncbi:MAG: hypothetical protein KC493_15255 [Bacteriovoracaceae bacterium]|nr:hypothetical protein [Bacteriovoracaceae bacterium]
MKLNIILGILLFSSCSTYVRDNCYTEGAANMGKEQALSWKNSESDAKAPNCSGNKHFGADKFKEVYTSSYNKQLELQCSRDSVKGQASVDNSNLSTDFILLERLDLCSKVNKNPSMLKKYYRGNIAKLYCHKNKTKEFATIHASTFKKFNLDHLKFCYKSTRRKLTKVYKKNYNEKIYSSCSIVNLTAKGIKDAVEGKEVVDGIHQIANCPKKTRSKGLKAYKESFYIEIERIEKKSRD